MGDTRVVITGVGVLTPWGDQLGMAWEAVQAGQVACRPATVEGLGPLADVSAGMVEGCSPGRYLNNPKSLKLMDKRSRMSVQAAFQAVADAGLPIERPTEARVGLYLCVGYSAVELADYLPFLTKSLDANGAFSTRLMGESAWRLIQPLKAFQFLSNLPLCHVSIELGLQGDHAVFYPDAMQGALALEEGFRGVAAGQLRAALVGGVSASGNLLGLICLLQGGGLARNAQAGIPFTRHHQGYIPAEACVYLVLESLQQACERRARVYAEVVGLGFSGDPLAAGDGVAANVRKSMEASLASRSAGRGEVGGVWAGSYRSLAEDEQELGAILTVLGPETKVTSTRGLLGHAFGASPFFDVAMASRALAEGCVHPLGRVHGADWTLPSVVRRTTPCVGPCAVVNVLGESGEAFSIALQSLTEKDRL